MISESGQEAEQVSLRYDSLSNGFDGLMSGLLFSSGLGHGQIDSELWLTREERSVIILVFGIEELLRPLRDDNDREEKRIENHNVQFMENWTKRLWIEGSGFSWVG